MEFNMQSYKDTTVRKVLTKKDLNKIVIRSFMLQACFNYERFQAAGWVYGLIPGLKKIHQDEDDLRLALVNHMQFFNTSPQLVTLVQGIILAMEENKESPESIHAVKVALMGPLGGIGGALFWLTALPISVGIGASLCLQGNVAGPFVFLLLYNVPYLAAKFGLMRLGYSGGVKAIDKLDENTAKISRAASIVGLAVVSALIANIVKLNIVAEFDIGGVLFNPQIDLLDKIMPALLPLLYTFGCYRLLKKGKNPLVVISITVVIGLLGSLLGIL